MNFFRYFMILSRINKGLYVCLFGHANTEKHVYEHSCSYVRVFLSILAHLAQSLFSDFKCNKWLNIFIIFLSKQIQERMSVSIAAHLWRCFKSSRSFSSFRLVFSRVHATLHPALSVGRSVCRSMKFYLFYDFYFWTSQLLPKRSSDLKYGPCPPTQNLGSLVFFLILNGR